MSCTKSQLLSLLSRIRKEIYACKDLECAKKVIDNYVNIVREKAETEAWFELLSG